MAGSIGRIATGAKAAAKFLWYGQEWGQHVGRAYKAAKLSNPATSLSTFGWKQSYTDFFTKKAGEAAKAAATKTGIKGFFSKLGGKIMPALILVTTAMSIWSATKEGGIIEGAKELLRGASGYAGAALVSLLAGILLANPVGLVGGLVLSIIGFTGGEWVAKKILGPSMAEQKAELAEKQQQVPLPYNNPSQGRQQSLEEMDRKFEQLKRMYNNRINNSYGMNCTPRGVNSEPQKTFVA